MYYSYLYQMGVFQKKPKRIPYEVREDIRRLDQRIAQIEFLQKQTFTWKRLRNSSTRWKKKWHSCYWNAGNCIAASPDVNGFERYRRDETDPQGYPDVAAD